MKRIGMKIMLCLLSIGVLTAFLPQQVMAVGTASNTPIENTATLDYKVGTVPQAQINSNINRFLVDNKVDLTVAEVKSTTVMPGESNKVLVFSVTNTGNTTQGYSFEVTGGTDDFDMTSVSIYLDVDNDGELSTGDTLHNSGTWVADIDPATATPTINILVVASTPDMPNNGDTAVYNLIATTLDAGTATVTANNSGDADDPTIMQVVWADGAGPDDIATDGKHSAAAVYTVASADLTVTKTQEVLNDPINLTSNPKAIPGSTVRYTITVANTGSSDATDVVLVDGIPINTTYVFGSTTLDGTSKSDINDPDEADFGSTNANSVTVNIATVAAGGSAEITFDVTID